MVSQPREVEHRIVAKPARSARAPAGFSVNAIRDVAMARPRSASAIAQTNTQRARSCFVGISSSSFQFFANLSPAAQRTCGMNPGRATESRHDQARVIGEDQPVLCRE